MRVLLFIISLASLVFVTAGASLQQQKYPWQHSGTQCNETLTLCWYGEEDVSDPQVMAYGNRWVAQDKDEKPLEWITEVRCLKDSKLCILARNQKVLNGSATNIDLYRIEEWGKVQIRAIGESDFPHGKECEIDTLLLNRAEGSVSMLSTPGPGAVSAHCKWIKPKTVVYKLDIGPPRF
jgi:hypothetical protein